MWRLRFMVAASENERRGDEVLGAKERRRDAERKGAERMLVERAYQCPSNNITVTLSPCKILS